ncbi:MAG: ABC transporter ATP-binding protein, partial [Kiritimatiellia bacterium]|nr:ABC transporter ATP-binding protein [Kiritimatiellia bacterium]
VTTALRLENIVKRYGRRRALDGLSLDIPGGSLTGLVGSNGAGKTTTLAVIMGFVRPQSGRVDLLESGPFDAARHAGRVAVLPQDAELPVDGRPLDLLTFYGALQGLTRPAARRQAGELLERVHLADRAQSPLRTLSHGMRKRFCIAQCFLGEPELILLDEPLSGLDPREASAMRDFFYACRGRQALLISSHNLHELEQICDRAVFMEQGRVTRADTMTALTRRAGLAGYFLAGENAPLDALREAIPEAEFEFDPAARRLQCRFDADLRDPAALNRAVLEILFGAGVGLLEIRLGDRLEQEYLRQV